MKSEAILKFKKTAIDFLIAPKSSCLGCTSCLGSNDSFLCPKCFASLSPLYITQLGVKKICNLCGREIDGLRCRCGGTVKNAFNTYSAYYFEAPVSALIKAFKYKSITNLAAWLSDEMIKSLKSETDFDLITCVPMHPLRKLKRGFNQAEILSKLLSERLNIPYAPVLKRKRFTKRQATLTGEKRRKNLIHAFSPHKIDIKDKRILIVDDVRTTGTTIISCANVLMKNGAKKVSAVTIVCGRGKKS